MSVVPVNGRWEIAINWKYVSRSLGFAEDYLRTVYRPDCDYLDAKLAARNWGDFEHSSAQREIILFLAARFPKLRKRLLPQQGVQVANRLRVPDVCILAEDAPRHTIIHTPPDLCIEILSPEDTLTRTIERVKDYFSMGMPLCRVVDPLSRTAWVATPGRLEEAIHGVLRADGIEMPLAEGLE